MPPSPICAFAQLPKARRDDVLPGTVSVMTVRIGSGGVAGDCTVRGRPVRRPGGCPILLTGCRTVSTSPSDRGQEDRAHRVRPRVPYAGPAPQDPVHAGDHRVCTGSARSSRRPAWTQRRSTPASTPWSDSSIYGLINLFSGGALLQLAIFALGIMPYITASIIVQLLAVVIPRFEQLKKEGQAGQTKLTQYTRYLTIGLAILQSTGIVALARPRSAVPRLSRGHHPERLQHRHRHHGRHDDRRHRGDHVARRADHRPRHRQRHVGADLHLDRVRIPAEVGNILQTRGGGVFAGVILMGLAIIAAVVFVEQAQRRIPVQYAKRMVGRRMYGGTSTYLPLKVNQAGVIPVIFASSLLYLPTLLSQLAGPGQRAWAVGPAEPGHRGDPARSTCSRTSG